MLWSTSRCGTPEFDVRRAKAALFLWVRNPPGHFHSDRKQLEQSER
jgi:hypothetical protein